MDRRAGNKPALLYFNERSENMNSAEYVDQHIQQLKNSGIPLSEAAWQAALLCVGWPYIFGDRGQYCTISHRQAVYNKGPDKKEYANVRKSCQAIRESNPTGSCSGCKWFPGSKRVRSYDCRGFTYWILLQIFGWELKGAGATSQWNTKSNWKSKGLVADGIPQGVIVCLFYTEKGNPKVMAHTGLYYNGETCDCSSGVQHSKTLNSKWTHWGVPACVDGDVPTPTPPTPTKPTLKKGSSGQYVTLLQTELINRGYSCGKSGADGKFGNDTLAAVKAFQKDHGLTADGIVGPKTWAALDNAEPTVYYTVTIPHLTQAAANQLLTNYPGGSMTKE